MKSFFDPPEPRHSEYDHTPRTQRREGPQVVGFPCAKCGERIVIAPEAVPCERCARPVHIACLPHAHDDDGATPYR